MQFRSKVKMMINARSLIKYIKILLPAVLVAFLVLDSIMAYKAPTFADTKSPVQTAAAKVKKPNLRLKQQKKGEKKKSPVGLGGSPGTVKEAGDYKDGEYTGSARGFGGLITVKVTIKNGKIAKVSIVSAPGEDAAYFNKAKSLTGTIAKRNSTNVDAVSGATYSSNGIIMAVRNALSKAAISDKAKKKIKQKSKKNKNSAKNDKRRKIKKNEPAKIPEPISEGTWKDGTYTGTGEGFGGELTVSVVIKDGRIVSVKIGKNSDDKEYLQKAKDGIIPKVIENQGTNVDTVSGATYSSAGILQAINDALSKAVVKNDSDQNNSSTADKTDKSSDSGQTQQTTEEAKTIDITKRVKVYCDADEDFDDYDLDVTVRFREGKAIAIVSATQVIPEPSNNSYIRAALNGIKRQISTKPDFQGIDTVSGATCTSLGIIEAGQLALQEAAGN